MGVGVNITVGVDIGVGVGVCLGEGVGVGMCLGVSLGVGMGVRFGFPMMWFGRGCIRNRLAGNRGGWGVELSLQPVGKSPR